jgi:hypothetical protein
MITGNTIVVSTSDTNISTIDAVIKQLEDLSAARRDWEEGSYKKSNEELYVLLDRCLALYVEIKGNRPLVMQLNAELKARGLTVQSNTALHTKIVRFVFGDCGKRLYTYARVIAVASAEKPETVSMLRFITEAGGVEAIRKKAASGMTPAERARLHIELAETAYASADAICTFDKSLPQLQPNTDEGGKFSVALLRYEANGTFSVVAGTANERILRTVLAEVGKCQADKFEATKPAETARVARAARDVLLAAA